MRSEERKKSLGEVFTPPELVEEMLDQLPPEVWTDHTKTFLDNSCGNGNFLVAVLDRLLNTDPDPLNALSRVHGVDIMQDNVDECRERLASRMADPSDPRVSDILTQNIVCADGLRYHYRFDGSAPYDDALSPDLFSWD